MLVNVQHGSLEPNLYGTCNDRGNKNDKNKKKLNIRFALSNET